MKSEGRVSRRDDILRILQQHEEELHHRFGVKSLELFGSAGRDEASETSDIDLLAELNRTVSFFDLCDLEDFLVGPPRRGEGGPGAEARGHR